MSKYTQAKSFMLHIVKVVKVLLRTGYLWLDTLIVRLASHTWMFLISFVVVYSIFSVFLQYNNFVTGTIQMSESYNFSVNMQYYSY
jgi:hypothetical protein